MIVFLLFKPAKPFTRRDCALMGNQWLCYDSYRTIWNEIERPEKQLQHQISLELKGRKKTLDIELSVLGEEYEFIKNLKDKVLPIGFHGELKSYVRLNDYVKNDYNVTCCDYHMKYKDEQDILTNLMGLYELTKEFGGWKTASVMEVAHEIYELFNMSQRFLFDRDSSTEYPFFYDTMHSQYDDGEEFVGPHVNVRYKLNYECYRKDTRDLMIIFEGRQIDPIPTSKARKSSMTGFVGIDLKKRILSKKTFLKNFKLFVSDGCKILKAEMWLHHKPRLDLF